MRLVRESYMINTLLKTNRRNMTNNPAGNVTEHFSLQQQTYNHKHFT